jgi:hypothetical protein
MSESMSYSEALDVLLVPLLSVTGPELGVPKSRVLNLNLCSFLKLHSLNFNLGQLARSDSDSDR